jgi:hypothetical protein
MQRQFVRAFGIEREEQRANQGIGNHGKGFYDAGRKMLPVSGYRAW